MFFQWFCFILYILSTFILPIKSNENCNIDYDRHKRSYGYSLTYHCSNLNLLSNDLLQIKDISEKKLPLKITSFCFVLVLIYF